MNYFSLSCLYFFNIAFLWCEFMQIVAVCSTEDVTLTGLQVSVRLTKVQEKALGLQASWQTLGFSLLEGVCVHPAQGNFFLITFFLDV